MPRHLHKPACSIANSRFRDSILWPMAFGFYPSSILSLVNRGQNQACSAWADPSFGTCEGQWLAPKGGQRSGDSNLPDRGSIAALCSSVILLAFSQASSNMASMLSSSGCPESNPGTDERGVPGEASAWVGLGCSSWWSVMGSPGSSSVNRTFSFSMWTCGRAATRTEGQAYFGGVSASSQSTFGWQ